MGEVDVERDAHKTQTQALTRTHTGTEGAVEGNRELNS